MPRASRQVAKSLAASPQEDPYLYHHEPLISPEERTWSSKFGDE